MPAFLLYLLKLSIGTSLVYLFYRLLLQRLTFYQANRWYLLAYPLLCCIIPMIDVAPLISMGDSATNTIIYHFPVVQQYVAPAFNAPAATVVQNGKELINPWTVVNGLLLAGMLFFSIRLLIRLASLMRIKKQAVLVGNYGVKLYKIQGNLLPFSFADSIYVNPDAYSPDELQQIIRHEQVHVNQKHTVDIILGELLCIINWYNPFAWLLRHAMRQNLEFIADNTVVNMGSDKRHYQYLLLKVTGVPVRGIVNQFNFSSLKKRIAMMNKIKSAKKHLLKFFFVLPMAAVLLLAFRDKVPAANHTYYVNGIVLDAITLQPIVAASVKEEFSGLSAVTDKNGYYSIALPINGNRLNHRCFVSAPGYHATMQDRVLLFKQIPTNDGTVFFVGLSPNGIGSFIKEGELPKKNGTLITQPDAAAQQQLYETAKATVIEDRETETDLVKPATDVPAITPTALQDVFDQSELPYHYINGTHYFINEQAVAATVAGSVDQLMIKAAGVLYTGEELNKKYKKQQIGACRIRLSDAATAGKDQQNAVVMEVTIKNK